MKLAIPYGISLEIDGKVKTMPVVYAKIQSAAGTKNVPGIFLIDSGAAITLLPATDAEALGLKLEAGEKILISGITNRNLLGYRHIISLIINGFSLKSIPVVFSKQNDTPRVLGREGVFPRFGILFDEAKKRIILLESKSERKFIDSAFIF